MRKMWKMLKMWKIIIKKKKNQWKPNLKLKIKLKKTKKLMNWLRKRLKKMMKKVGWICYKRKIKI